MIADLLLYPDCLAHLTQYLTSLLNHLILLFEEADDWLLVFHSFAAPRHHECRAKVFCDWLGLQLSEEPSTLVHVEVKLPYVDHVGRYQYANLLHLLLNVGDKLFDVVVEPLPFGALLTELVPDLIGLKL